MGAQPTEDVTVQAEEVSQETVETSTEAVKPETRQVVIATTDEDEVSQETPADSQEASDEQSEETPSEESQQETTPDSSLKEEAAPKLTKFEERLQNIEDKIKAESRFAQDVMEVTNEDPQLKLELTRRLEARGKLPAGSTEIMAKSLQIPMKEKAESEVREETLTPEQRFLQTLMREEEEKQAKEALRRENVLQDFENRHPDIAQRENAIEARRQIAVLESAYKAQGLSEAEALDEAYNVLFNRDALINKAREKGVIEGQIQAQTKAIASTPSGSGEVATSALRKLTKEEDVARKFLGMTVEDYIAHKDAMAVENDF